MAAALRSSVRNRAFIHDDFKHPSIHHALQGVLHRIFGSNVSYFSGFAVGNGAVRCLPMMKVLTCIIYPHINQVYFRWWDIGILRAQRVHYSIGEQV